MDRAEGKGVKLRGATYLSLSEKFLALVCGAVPGADSSGTDQ